MLRSFPWPLRGLPGGDVRHVGLGGGDVGSEESMKTASHFQWCAVAVYNWACFVASTRLQTSLLRVHRRNRAVRPVQVVAPLGAFSQSGHALQWGLIFGRPVVLTGGVRRAG